MRYWRRILYSVWIASIFLLSENFSFGLPADDQITIVNIQKALKNAGYYSGPIDGKKSSALTEAIKNFQRKNNLEVDGIVGEKETWPLLRFYLKESDLKSSSGAKGETGGSKKSFVSSPRNCPKEGCFDLGLITEWGFVKVTNGGTILDVFAFRLSPSFGYFFTDSFELAFSPSILLASVGSYDLSAFAFPVSAIFNFQVQKDLYLSAAPFLGFVYGKAEGYDGVGFTFGAMFGLRHRLINQVFLNAGLGFLYSYLKIDEFFVDSISIYYFAPDVGISYFF